MKLQFVADGKWRLRSSEGFRARETELYKAICGRFTDQLSTAGFSRRLLIRIQIFIAYRSERRHILPSRGALYFLSR